ncbi:MAG: zinc ribbon domain-containing protein [Peptostreptococcaceae bacterium]|nr:zinc ribbon domain-containing protein [Peptostreptococcaceae bacterium]
MIFIWGVSSKQKNLDHHAGLNVHEDCGQYAQIEVIMTYSCFSLFFIPLFRWNKRYYAKYHCCKRLYELDPSVGKQIEKGLSPKINPQDLSWVS